MALVENPSAGMQLDAEDVLVLLGRPPRASVSTGVLRGAAGGKMPALSRLPASRCCGRSSRPVAATALDRPGVDPAWITEEGGLRLRPDYWPEAGGMDGFYIAVLQKPA